MSSLLRNAPCNRAGSLLPGGMNSMSPLPSSDSAPMPSMIVRLSICDATRNAMRLGKFALIRPVMTFTLGRCVARIRWMPMARAFGASIASGVSTSAAQVIMRSASSSMTTTMYGSTFPLYSRSSKATPASLGFTSGCPSRTLALKSWMLRAPLAARSL